MHGFGSVGDRYIYINIKTDCIVLEKYIKGNNSIPLLESQKSIDRKRIRVTSFNRRKHITYTGKTTKVQKL